MENIKVEYSSMPKSVLDEQITNTMSEIGFVFIGSGYNFKTKKRDLCFSDGEIVFPLTNERL